MGKIARSRWINDDGTGKKGTPINDQELQKIYDAIDSEIASGIYPTITTKSIIEDNMVGLPYHFGGSMDVAMVDNAYPSGSDPFIMVPNSGIFRADPSFLNGKLFQLEGVLQTANAAHTTRVGLFNLTDAPDSPIAAILLTGTTTATLVRSADLNLFWGTAGSLKDFALKGYTSTAGGAAKAWGLRLFRTG